MEDYEDVSYTDTEVVPSNHFESVTCMLRRLHDAGFMLVQRSIVKFGKQIGRGGQGTVYEATVSWPYMDKGSRMAVKKFNSQRGISQGQYPRELWTKEHMHVVRPNAFFIDADLSLCMIMPLFSGDLRSVIDVEMKTGSGSPIEDAVAFTIIMQLAMGMKVLHSAGVCHRDLKAANILLRSFEMPEALQAVAGLKYIHHCYIADFESSENMKGTAFWRAPEVLMSLRTGIPLTDFQWRAADVYSFGMVCYEIVTGEIPFESIRFSDYDNVINGGRPELPEYVPEVLRKIIMECWHSNPQCRPDFCEILRMLRPVAEKEGSLASILSSTWEELLSAGKRIRAESIEKNLWRFEELVSRHCVGNEEAVLYERHYAGWGLKFMLNFRRLEEEVNKDHYTSPLISFVDYIKVQKLEVFMNLTLRGYLTTLNCDSEQNLKDMIEHGSSCIQEKARMGDLALKIHQLPRERIQRIEMKNIDNDLTLKEKLKLAEDLVRKVKDELDEIGAFDLIEKIFVKLDLGKSNLEVAISRSHMEIVICRTMFERKYKTLLGPIGASIMMYFLYNSSYFHSILFQVFGVMKSDTYGIFMWFLFPLLEIALSLFRFRFRKYYYFFNYRIKIYYCYKFFRAYGFRQLIGWIAFQIALPTVVSICYTLLIAIHEYFVVKRIRLAQSLLFADRVKTKEE